MPDKAVAPPAEAAERTERNNDCDIESTAPDAPGWADIAAADFGKLGCDTIVAELAGVELGAADGSLAFF